MTDPYLTTERLILRRFRPGEASLLHELDSDPEVIRYAQWGVAQPPTEQQSEEMLERFLAQYDRWDGLGTFAIEADGDFLGWFHWRPYREEDRVLELGYRLRRDAWGRGYATEGSRGLIDMARREASARKAVATALTANRASIRVMEKCGMQREAEYLDGPYQQECVRYGLRLV